MLLIGFERVTNLICRCYVYENLYLHKGPYEAAMAPHANSNLRAALLRLYVGLLNFIARGIRIASKSTAGRLITAWFDAEALQTQLNNLDSLERTVFYEAENSGVVLVTEGQRRLQQLLEDFRETLWRVDSTTLAMARDRSGQKRKEILKWISDSPYKDHHYDAAKGRLEGTGDWLFAHDQYLKWQQSEASCTLWLYGSRKLPTPSFSLLLIWPQLVLVKQSSFQSSSTNITNADRTQQRSHSYISIASEASPAEETQRRYSKALSDSCLLQLVETRCLPLLQTCMRANNATALPRLP